MITRILIAFTALSLLPICSSADFLPPVVTVRKVAGAEGLLGQPAQIQGFLNVKGRSVPTQQIEVRLAYDDSNLYVAFRCFDDKPGNLTAACTDHDGPVWRDDSIEVFLDPLHDGKTHFHFIANAAGVKFESKGVGPKPEAWNGEWQVAVTQEDKAWTALVTIPFASIGFAAPSLTMTWDANFCRHEVTKNEMSSWSPVVQGFPEPDRFGQIIFGDENSPAPWAELPEIASPGVYQASTTSSADLDAQVLCDGKVIGRSHGRQQFDFNLRPEGKCQLSVVFKDTAGKLITRTPPMEVNIPPHGARLARFRQVVQGLKPNTSEQSKELGALKESLDALADFEKGARGGKAMWQQLGDKLDAIESRVTSLRCACIDKKGIGYVVGADNPLRKVFRDKFFEGTIGEPARVSAARNEYEAVQAVVIAYDKALEGTEVSVSALPVDVSVNLVDYVKTRQPRYEVDYVGWHPDPLMDMKPFDLPAGGIQPIWITVHPKEGTPAGTYRGQITITPANAPETVLPLEVRVWDFALPKESHLKTAFALFPHEISAWYGGYTPEIRRAYYQFLLDHRINPTNIYSKAPVPTMEDLPFCLERGLNAFSLTYTHNKGAEDRAELKKMIKELEDDLKANGAWSKAYIYGFDEILPDKYGELRDMYGWLKTEFPDLPRMCTVIPNEELKGYVDIWVPLTANFKPKDAEEYTKAGNQVWWYVCCNPAPPYANFFVDSPAVDPRALFWMNWKYHVPGFLYYAMNMWTTNRSSAAAPNEQIPHDDPAVRQAIQQGKRWPEVPWNTFTFSDVNGDGHLIYPGPGGKPVSSIRLECIRDGIEDYEYLYLLNELVSRGKGSPAFLAKGKKLLETEEVVRSLTDYTLDPEPLLRNREAIAQTIEKLQL